MWCSKSVHRRSPFGLLLQSSANSLPATTICCALQGWLGIHRTRPDRWRARGACAGGFGGPFGFGGLRLRWARGAKCLRAGDSALWPAHCPTFLPVTSRKCFGMLSTAQNRCGVFAGIVATLTGRVKTAFVSAGCTRKTINYAPPAARACMQFRVKRCIIY